MYREHFLKQALGNVQECRNAFYRRDLVKNEVQEAWFLFQYFYTSGEILMYKRRPKMLKFNSGLTKTLKKRYLRYIFVSNSDVSVTLCSLRAVPPFSYEQRLSTSVSSLAGK